MTGALQSLPRNTLKIENGSEECLAANMRTDMVLSKAEFLTVAGATLPCYVWLRTYIAAANKLAQNSNLKVIKAPSLRFTYS